MKSITLLAVAAFAAPVIALAEQAEHIDQSQFNALSNAGKMDKAFDLAFDVGDELFEHNFTAEEGIGVNVGNGSLFARVPRADLIEPGQWASQTPQRFTGPNEQSCNACHNQPFGDGAGTIAMNNMRDPSLSGDISKFISRQPPHLFGMGALQLLAEEITTDLHAQRDSASALAMASGQPQQVQLRAKGTYYGLLIALPDGSFDTSNISGIDADLVIKPFEWKGLTHSVRAFVRGASHQELGMQATELVGYDIDGDFDGVVNELSVGDVTAITIYQAAQPRPVTSVELSELGLIDTLTAAEIRQINHGEQVFGNVGCASCHSPEMTLNNPVFSEPSRHASYRDILFPSGDTPADSDLLLTSAITFDLTKDLPDNVLETGFQFGNFETDAAGHTIVALFSDMKRHDMGEVLAEPVAENGIAPAIFLTQELWGVGSTPPYMHDGRATTLNEAILLHGGEAELSQMAYSGISEQDRAALIAFLENLVLFKTAEE